MKIKRGYFVIILVLFTIISTVYSQQETNSPIIDDLIYERLENLKT